VGMMLRARYSMRNRSAGAIGFPSMCARLFYHNDCLRVAAAEPCASPVIGARCWRRLKRPLAGPAPDVGGFVMPGLRGCSMPRSAAR
jgi:hypothetical protein